MQSSAIKVRPDNRQRRISPRSWRGLVGYFYVRSQLLSDSKEYLNTTIWIGNQILETVVIVQTMCTNHRLTDSKQVDSRSPALMKFLHEGSSEGTTKWHTLFRWLSCSETTDWHTLFRLSAFSPQLLGFQPVDSTLWVEKLKVIKSNILNLQMNLHVKKYSSEASHEPFSSH